MEVDINKISNNLALRTQKEETNQVSHATYSYNFQKKSYEFLGFSLPIFILPLQRTHLALLQKACLSPELAEPSCTTLSTLVHREQADCFCGESDLGAGKLIALQNAYDTGSSVGTVSDNGLDGRGSIPDRGRGFFL
jgi:hypothetical protein